MREFIKNTLNDYKFQIAFSILISIYAYILRDEMDTSMFILAMFITSAGVWATLIYTLIGLYKIKKSKNE